MKNNKGITLLALIITIIVMMILAGVSMTMLFGENGVIIQANKSTEEYQKQAKLEKVMTDIYFNKNTAGKNIKDETVEKLAKLIVENNLDVDSLHVYYDINTGNEIISYKYDIVLTSEERRKMESLGIKVLRGDANKDGNIDEIDVAFLRAIPAEQSVYDEYLLRTCDFNVSGSVNEYDGNVLYLLTSGKYSIDFYDKRYDERNSEEYNSRKIRRYKKTLPEIEFVEYEDKYTNTAHVVYMYNERITSSDEETLKNFDEFKVGNSYIGVKMLKGDVNQDGFFDELDIDLIKKYLENTLEGEEKVNFENKISIIIKIVDVDKNNKIEENDLLKLTNILDGNEPMYSEWVV